MRSDPGIKRDLEDELRWDPDIDSSDIGVTVKTGLQVSPDTQKRKTRRMFVFRLCMRLSPEAPAQ